MWRQLYRESPGIVKYVGLTAAYGFVRKLVNLHDAHTVVTSYDNETRERVDEKVPLLVSEKCMVLSLSMFVSPVLFPFYAMDDIKNFEVYIRNLSPEKYKPHRRIYSPIDYVFQ